MQRRLILNQPFSNIREIFFSPFARQYVLSFYWAGLTLFTLGEQVYSFSILIFALKFHFPAFPSSNRSKCVRNSGHPRWPCSVRFGAGICRQHRHECQHRQEQIRVDCGWV